MAALRKLIKDNIQAFENPDWYFVFYKKGTSWKCERFLSFDAVGYKRRILEDALRDDEFAAVINLPLLNIDFEKVTKIDLEKIVFDVYTFKEHLAKDFLETLLKF